MRAAEIDPSPSCHGPHGSLRWEEPASTRFARPSHRYEGGGRDAAAPRRGEPGAAAGAHRASRYAGPTGRPESRTASSCWGRAVTADGRAVVRTAGGVTGCARRAWGETPPIAGGPSLEQGLGCWLLAGQGLAPVAVALEPLAQALESMLDVPFACRQWSAPRTGDGAERGAGLAVWSCWQGQQAA